MDDDRFISYFGVPLVDVSTRLQQVADLLVRETPASWKTPEIDIPGLFMALRAASDLFYHLGRSSPPETLAGLPHRSPRIRLVEIDRRHYTCGRCTVLCPRCGPRCEPLNDYLRIDPFERTFYAVNLSLENFRDGDSADQLQLWFGRCGRCQTVLVG